MNTKHYPSLELCKKLTGIGFPDTQYGYVNFDIDSWYPYGRDNSEEYFYIKSEFVISGRKYEKGRKNDIWISDLTKDKDEIKEEDAIRYVCPSIMEMLDVMPKEIEKDGHKYWLTIVLDFTIVYTSLKEGIPNLHCHIGDTWLPNALAEMILWLHENNYISFSK